MIAPVRVVSGQVTDVAGDLVTIETGTDPDTGATATTTARLPGAPAVGQVATVVIGPHGAVVIPAAGAAAGIDVTFRSYAELRDGITVPRAPAPAPDPAPTPAPLPEG